MHELWLALLTGLTKPPPSTVCCNQSNLILTFESSSCLKPENSGSTFWSNCFYLLWNISVGVVLTCTVSAIWELLKGWDRSYSMLLLLDAMKKTKSTICYSVSQHLTSCPCCDRQSQRPSGCHWRHKSLKITHKNMMSLFKRLINIQRQLASVVLSQHYVNISKQCCWGLFSSADWYTFVALVSISSSTVMNLVLKPLHNVCFYFKDEETFAHVTVWLWLFGIFTENDENKKMCQNYFCSTIFYQMTIATFP